MRWLQLLDVLIGIVDMMRGGGPTRGGMKETEAASGRAAGERAAEIERERMAFEREHLMAERERADRAAKLEAFRQSGDREIARLRLTAVIAIISLVGTLLFFAQVVGALFAALRPDTRLMLAAGWLLLLSALPLSFHGQQQVARALARLDPEAGSPPGAGLAATIAPWLITLGLVVVGLAAFRL